MIDPDEMVLYLETGLGAEKAGEEGLRQAFDLGGAAFGSRIELIHEPDVRPGTWHFAEGTAHHWAWDVANEDSQMHVKGWIEGLGFTDVTEQKDRGYFLSCYNRTPGGALFEYAFTPADRGFLIDEPEDQLGTSVQIPPPFAHLADEMLPDLDATLDRAPATLQRVAGFDSALRGVVPNAESTLKDANPMLAYLEPIEDRR